MSTTTWTLHTKIEASFWDVANQDFNSLKAITYQKLILIKRRVLRSTHVLNDSFHVSDKLVTHSFLTVWYFTWFLYSNAGEIKWKTAIQKIFCTILQFVDIIQTTDPF